MNNLRQKRKLITIPSEWTQEITEDQYLEMSGRPNCLEDQPGFWENTNRLFEAVEGKMRDRIE